MVDRSVILKAVGKTFGAVKAVSDLNLVAQPGSVLGLTGPSGAGKTTTCRLISGLESATAGEISHGGQRWNGMPPQQRQVSYMFESYALYPQLSVFDNIAFPLRAPNKKGRHGQGTIAERVQEVIALTEMQGLERRLPAELSGGQKQRVALCRALVQEPSIYLLDEPISHLDAKLRHKLRGEIRRRQKAKDAPTLWSTPDAMEALSVSDRVAVIIGGRVQQTGTPEDVYRRPANVSVARLIGDPAMNLIPGQLSRDDGRLDFRFDGGRLALPEGLCRHLEQASGAERVLLGVRPTDLVLSDPEADPGTEQGTARGTIYTFEPFGKYSVATVRLGGSLIKAKSTAAMRFDIEDPVGVRFVCSDLVLFDEATGRAMSF